MMLRPCLSLVTLLSLSVAPNAILWGSNGEDEKQRQSGLATTKLVLTRQVEHLEGPAREPMIIEHPSGAQFVTGYGAGRPRLLPEPRSRRDVDTRKCGNRDPGRHW